MAGYDLSNFSDEDLKRLYGLSSKINNMVPPNETRRVLENDSRSSLSSFGRIGEKIEGLEKRQRETAMGTLDSFSGGGFRAFSNEVKNKFQLFWTRILDSWEERATIRYEEKQGVLKEEWIGIAGDEFPFVKDKNSNRINVSNIEDIKKYGMTAKERSEKEIKRKQLDNVKKDTVNVIQPHVSLVDKISAAEAQVKSSGLERKIVKEKSVGMER